MGKLAAYRLPRMVSASESKLKGNRLWEGVRWRLRWKVPRVGGELLLGVSCMGGAVQGGTWGVSAHGCLTYFLYGWMDRYSDAS